MKLEEARAIANKQLVELMQPYINLAGEGQDIDVVELEEKIGELKFSLAQETGFEVEDFYIDPMPYGFYEMTTIFREDERVYNGI